MTKNYGEREREAFMAGWSRKVTWDEYSEGHTDWYVTRDSFMRGYSRREPWRGNTGG